MRSVGATTVGTVWHWCRQWLTVDVLLLCVLGLVALILFAYLVILIAGYVQRVPRAHWASHWRLYTGASAVAAVLLAAWLARGAPVPAWLDFSDVEYDAWLTTTEGVHFQWKKADPSENDDFKVPIVDCATYPLAAHLQDQLLEPVEDDVDTDVATSRTGGRGARGAKQLNIETELTRQRRARREAIESARLGARGLCLWREASVLHFADAQSEASGGDPVPHLTHANAPSLTQALAAHTGGLDGKVAALLLGPPGSSQWYVRAQALVPRPSAPTVGGGSPAAAAATGSGPGRRVAPDTTARIEVRPVLVTAADIVRAAAEWEAFVQRRVKAALKSIPCLCPAHLGIVGSDLVLLRHPPDAPLEQQRWRVLLQRRIVETKYHATPQITTVDYLPILGRFPYEVHMRLNLTQPFLRTARLALAVLDLGQLAQVTAAADAEFGARAEDSEAVGDAAVFSIEPLYDVMADREELIQLTSDDAQRCYWQCDQLELALRRAVAADNHTSPR